MIKEQGQIEKIFQLTNERKTDTEADKTTDGVLDPVNSKFMYKSIYEDLSAAVENMHGIFKTLASKESLEDSLQKRISEAKPDDPFILAQIMTQAIESIIILREKPQNSTNASVEANNSNETQEARIEALLQKSENDVRQHIRIEQQLKIIIETLQSKYEDLEKEKDNITNSSKVLMRELKLDNVKLAELVKNKEKEIVNLTNMIKRKEDQAERVDVSNSQAEAKSRSQIGRGAQRESEEVKRFYEAELKALHKQVGHLQRILAMNLIPEEKLRILQSELNSVKEYSMKKIQVIESRLKIINHENGSPEHSTTNKDKMFSDSQNETNESRFQNQALRDFSEFNIKPMSSQGNRKQTGPEQVSFNKEGGNYASLNSLGPKSKIHVLQKILNDKKGAIDGKRSVSVLRQSSEIHKKSINLSNSREQREPSFEHYFKNASSQFEIMNRLPDKDREKEPQMRSFDNRVHNSSKSVIKTNSVRGKPSRNSSLEKMPHDSAQGVQKISSETRPAIYVQNIGPAKKGSQSNLRGSVITNSGVIRKGSYSILDKYKFSS